MEFYSKTLGVDYPWNKYSQIVVRDYVSGAMEISVQTTRHKETVLQVNFHLRCLFSAYLVADICSVRLLKAHLMPSFFFKVWERQFHYFD